jgi:hypothetical protein
MPAEFELDAQYQKTDDVLGLSYSAFKDNSRALFLSNPNEYFKLRMLMVTKIKRTPLQILYNSIYGLLTAAINCICRNRVIDNIGDSA